MGSLEEQKKLLIPFVQRAQEVEKAEPKIAYYCRMYALEQGMEVRRDVRAPEISALLGALMDKLEKDRKVVQLGSKAEDSAHCENFALTVFNRADRVDRAGRADKSTAMTFYAASYFMEILRHFGEPPADIQQKQRYAAWRAAEINKAVKEGRTPEPPPAAGQAALDDEASLLKELEKLEMAGGGASSAGASSAPAAQQQQQQPPPPPPLLGGDDGWAPPPPAAPDSPTLRLPSPPKQRPVEGQSSSGSVWVPPPPRRFQSFQKVLVNVEGAPGPVHGTVAKVEEGPHPEHPTYLVALPDRIVSISDATSLAPVLATSETVMYHGPSGRSMEATVAEVDLSHWPPSYLVRLADGSYVDTTDDRLYQLNVPRPHSEPYNLDALPGAAGPAAPATAPPPAPPPQQQQQHATAAPPPAGLYPPPATGLPPPPAPAPHSGSPSTSPPRVPQPPQPAAVQPQLPPPAAPPQRAAPAAFAPPPQPVPGFQPGLREITDAAKLTKSATSALQFEDVSTAVKLLTEALTMLTQPPRRK